MTLAGRPIRAAAVPAILVQWGLGEGEGGSRTEKAGGGRPAECGRHRMCANTKHTKRGERVGENFGQRYRRATSNHTEWGKEGRFDGGECAQHTPNTRA